MWFLFPPHFPRQRGAGQSPAAPRYQHCAGPCLSWGHIIWWTPNKKLPSSRTAQIKAQSEASNGRSPITEHRRCLHSLSIIFRFITGNGGKSHTSLGHTGAVTRKQHRGCVLQVPLAARPSSGCEKWVCSSGMYAEKDLQSRVIQSVELCAHFLRNCCWILFVFHWGKRVPPRHICK